jgi:hypothetical protein
VWWHTTAAAMAGQARPRSVMIGMDMTTIWHP